jgi:hypothetical protein
MAYTTINKGSSYFNTVLYTGNGSTQSITGVGFKPDWTWIKCRSAANGHTLWDSVRGVTKFIDSAFDYPEQTNVNGLTAFNSDGFSIGTLGDVNANGASQVSWNWLGANTTASNTNGSITSTVSANTTSGFSVVGYTGTGSAATVGHGLGTAPSMIFLKIRSATDAWIVYSQALGNTKIMVLNSTAAVQTRADWNNTSPTSSVFSIGTFSNENTNGATYIAYCFAEKKGFSKFGSYTGNGNADGTFVYTGFKPAYLMIKRSDSVSQWRVWDNKRNTYNVTDTVLLPNDTGADVTNSSQYVDLLSNGFKWRASYVDTNASGGTFIYAAFAENPFVSSTSVPTTAR